MAFGPGGDQYIVDAAANAIIRRDAQTGAFNFSAAFADVPNPAEVGPPMLNAVPTDIVYAARRFCLRQRARASPSPEARRASTKLISRAPSRCARTGSPRSLLWLWTCATRT